MFYIECTNHKYTFGSNGYWGYKPKTYSSREEAEEDAKRNGIWENSIIKPSL